ncbi:MAG: TRAP transporter permease DctQ, partial [Alphaproteobacteria bacterium HGW-Alphaproteobacteria-2]
ANLPQTTGRWFPLGFEEMRRTSYRGWYETEDIPMPDALRFIEPWMNDGDAYGKLPRFIPYVILPVGAALLLLRLVQASLKLARGETETLIASHEAQDALADADHGKGN